MTFTLKTALNEQRKVSNQINVLWKKQEKLDIIIDKLQIPKYVSMIGKCYARRYSDSSDRYVKLIRYDYKQEEFLCEGIENVSKLPAHYFINVRKEEFEGKGSSLLIYMKLF